MNFIDTMVSIFVNLVSSAIYDQIGNIAVRIIEKESCRLPPLKRDRLKAEWLAELEVLPNNFAKLKYALEQRATAGNILREYQLDAINGLSTSGKIQHKRTTFIINGSGYYKRLCKQYFQIQDTAILLEIVKTLVEIEPNENRRRSLLRMGYMISVNYPNGIFESERCDEVMGRLMMDIPKYVPRVMFRRVVVFGN
jgi:hypothetical protein